MITTGRQWGEDREGKDTLKFRQLHFLLPVMINLVLWHVQVTVEMTQSSPDGREQVNLITLKELANRREPKEKGRAWTSRPWSACKSNTTKLVNYSSHTCDQTTCFNTVWDLSSFQVTSLGNNQGRHVWHCVFVGVWLSTNHSACSSW